MLSIKKNLIKNCLILIITAIFLANFIGCNLQENANDDISPEALGISGRFIIEPIDIENYNLTIKSLPVSGEGYSTQVWDILNQWNDVSTSNARQSGIAWGSNSGLTWDEKYSKWIQSMIKIDSDNGYYKTLKLSTPFGKTLPAPALECAEVAIFLRITKF